MIINPANRIKDVKEYYFSKKLAEIARLRGEGKDIINIAIGSPDLSPSPSTIEALIKKASEEGVHGYQSYKGIPELRSAIADWSGKIYQIQLDSDTEILPLMGSKEGIMHISLAFLNEGDEVLVPNPGYPTYSSVSNIVQAKLRHYDLRGDNDWEVDIDQLEKEDLSKVKLMWINYPNMPTGVKASTTLFKRLIKLAKDNQFLLVNDNPYSLILNEIPTSILSIEGAKEVALELNSFSKSHNMAGWRVGWLAGSKDYINTVLRVKSNMDSGMFLPVQHAAIEALSNTSQWHTEQNEEYRARRTFVWEIFDQLECTYDKEQVGMFVWAKVPENIKSVEEIVDSILYKANVFITPGFIFGSNGERFLRISLCTNQKLLKEALGRIEEFVKKEVTL